MAPMVLQGPPCGRVGYCCPPFTNALEDKTSRAFLYLDLENLSVALYLFTGFHNPPIGGVTDNKVGGGPFDLTPELAGFHRGRHPAQMTAIMADIASDDDFAVHVKTGRSLDRIDVGAVELFQGHRTFRIDPVGPGMGDGVVLVLAGIQDLAMDIFPGRAQTEE